jgi:hypothetical protein
MKAFTKGDVVLIEYLTWIILKLFISLFDIKKGYILYYFKKRMTIILFLLPLIKKNDTA